MNSTRPHPVPAAFTLVELLVVMAILTLVMTLTTALCGHAINLRDAAKARVVAERSAAGFMRQFESDLTQRVIRREAPVRFEKLPGNDAAALVTLRPGYALRSTAADRGVALVAYRVREHQALERAACGYGFGSITARPDEGAGTLALAAVPVDGPPLPEERAYQVIAPGLIRLEWSFLVRDGGTRVVRAAPPGNQDLIDAVVVTMVTLDPDRARMLGESEFRTLANAFRDARDGELPGAEWQETANNLVRELPRFPKPPLQHLRVKQGMFPLPKPHSKT
jgi:prepilin-type N-terminal cleavage/methylation domain-containing protein